MKFSSLILLALLLFVAPLTAANAVLKASLDSSYLVKGEETGLTVYLQADQRPTTQPIIPSADHVTINFRQSGVRPLQNRQLIYVFTYTVRSFMVGTHTIPAFSMDIGGQSIESIPVELRVAPLDELTWNSQSEIGQTFKYASAIFTPEASPYDGQTFPAEIKIYLPNNTGGARTGVAELNYDGLVAWRFEAVPATTQVHLPTGAHTGVIFRSTASPIRSGKTSLGPGSVRLMMRVRYSERGMVITRDMPANFKIPQHIIQAKPLPTGAPEGFAGAVGSFMLSATAEVDELEDGDPIAVRLSVIGTGNLDSLPAPRLDAPDSDWKTYEPSRLERQGERRDVTGAVSFSQIVRPLNVQVQVPPFELVYFNPQTARYASTRTKPIPFKTKPSPRGPGSASIIPTLATPVEDMKGILAVIDPLRSQPGSGSLPWLRFWHFFPALLAAALLYRIAQLRVLPRFQTSERERQISRSLAELAAADNNEGTFLRAAGAFVERWIPDEEREDELTALLARRDTDCFRPDHAERTISPKDRQSLLKTLKARALSTLPALVLFATLFLAGPIEANTSEAASFDGAEGAYREGNYRTALEFYSTSPAPHSADVLYNIGNCHYQLDAPGKAVLYYHRALLLDPTHPESLQNLRFTKRTLGTLSIVREPYQTNLAKLSRSAYQTITSFGGWLTGLALLSFFAFAPGAGKVLSSIALGCGALVTSAGVACQIYYPDDAEFAILAERAVMTNSSPIKAHTDASETSPSVIDVPPGSLCRILAPRGNWTYVQFPNRTRAWVPTPKVTPLLPSDPEEGDRL